MGVTAIQILNRNGNPPIDHGRHDHEESMRPLSGSTEGRGRTQRWFDVSAVIVLSLAVCSTTTAAQNVTLYATNALSASEATLHVLDPDTGRVLRDVGPVVDVVPYRNATMGVFGMCHHGDLLYAVNDQDQFITIHPDTAEAGIVGAVSYPGLYDLACGSNNVAYSYSTIEHQLVAISYEDASATLVDTEPIYAEAISMDLDNDGTLWLLQNGTHLSKLDVDSGVMQDVATLDTLVDQRHGSLRPGTTHLYSVMFESSSLWIVNLSDGSVMQSMATELSSVYTLAFAAD